MNHSTLNTDRFVLKVLTPEMVSETYLSWFSNPDTSQFIYYAKNEISLNELKKYVSQKLENPETLMFGIFTKDKDLHIGNIKFEPVNIENHYAVMGILIGDNEWRGKGVFIEIDNILMQALKKLEIRNIFLGVDKDNLAAIKAYLKAGYSIDANDFLKVSDKKSITMKKSIT